MTRIYITNDSICICEYARPNQYACKLKPIEIYTAPAVLAVTRWIFDVFFRGNLNAGEWVRARGKEKAATACVSNTQRQKFQIDSHSTSEQLCTQSFVFLNIVHSSEICCEIPPFLSEWLMIQWRAKKLKTHSISRMHRNFSNIVTWMGYLAT